MREELSKKFLQTYIYTEKYGNFFVSTCYRRSSAMLSPDSWYYETLAWKLDDDGEREHRIIADNSGAVTHQKAFEQHTAVCIRLSLTGEFVDETD